MSDRSASSKNKITEFKQVVKRYFRQHQRDLPWRQPEADGSFDPYKILVSEVMLQQTQANRVVPKYIEFLQVLPTVDHLAETSLATVLGLWSGLGYNRRAKYLWQTAGQLRDLYDSQVPNEFSKLEQLPGIGPNTAGAILAYSYNQPAVFIETNIRSVYLHHFFPAQNGVTDNQLVPLVAATLDHAHPREWYWALMDYGTYLKATHKNPSRRSHHHTRQSQFAGSKRQLRGQVLQSLLNQSLTLRQLQAVIPDQRLTKVLTDLAREHLISSAGDRYQLGK